jgi:hypothetical protein
MRVIRQIQKKSPPFVRMKGTSENCLWVFIMFPLQETQHIIKALLGSLSIAPLFHLRNHYKVFRQNTVLETLYKIFGEKLISICVDPL